VTAYNFSYIAFNLAVPVGDVAYKKGSKEGDMSYIRPVCTLTDIRGPVDVFRFHVKISYHNRQPVGMQLSRETQKIGDVRPKRLLRDSENHIQNHIQNDTASQPIRTKYGSVIR
jgi:hypothetical protein